jgi:hypothetical protein
MKSGKKEKEKKIKSGEAIFTESLHAAAAAAACTSSMLR